MAATLSKKRVPFDKKVDWPHTCDNYEQIWLIPINYDQFRPIMSKLWLVASWDLSKGSKIQKALWKHSYYIMDTVMVVVRREQRKKRHSRKMKNFA